MAACMLTVTAAMLTQFGPQLVEDVRLSRLVAERNASVAKIVHAAAELRNAVNRFSEFGAGT